MIISMWDKFVFQKMQWKLAHMGLCRGMYKHERGDQERQKDNKTWFLSPPWRHGTKWEETTLKHSGRICCMLGNAALSQSWNWADVIYTSSSEDPQNKSKQCASGDLICFWNQHPRLPFSRPNIHFLSCPLCDTSPLGCLPPVLIQDISARVNMLGQNPTPINNSKPVLSVLSADTPITGSIWTLEFPLMQPVITKFY